MSDRFDLEQQILDCWGIVDDLNRAPVNAYTKALQVVYQEKFEHLFNTFEQLVHKRIIK